METMYDITGENVFEIKTRVKRFKKIWDGDTNSTVE